VISAAQLLQIFPSCTLNNAQKYEIALADAMREYQIDTKIRQAAFLGQIGHESMQLACVRELWGPTESQVKYEGDALLGNSEPGDGKRYLGRGLIQITGRVNYRTCSTALFGDEGVLLKHPERLEEPILAARSAGWFWRSRCLNDLADRDDYARITKRINGGMLGFKERLEFWKRARIALGVSITPLIHGRSA
jgi:putative chitinase